MTDTVTTTPRHPATFSAVWTSIAEAVVDHVTHGARILDPFAGVGLVHRLAALDYDTVGVEIEREWAEADPRTVHGDARVVIPALGRFDAVVTSPCYGNRMADHHEAKDPCPVCGGAGVVGYGDEDTDADQVCRACDGSGLSRRNTYRHAIGRKLAPGSSAAMQWGPVYRAFHEHVWIDCWNALTPGGLALVNVKNHYRGKGAQQRVVEFHLNWWLVLGAELVEARHVPARGNRQGANGSRRVDGEKILVVRKPRELED